MTAPEVLMLAGLGGLCAMDIVAFPQAMFSRPIVSATLAGFILGEPAAALAVGVMLELFALDVLPVGASEYPDYGPAGVVAAAVVSDAAGTLYYGYAVLIGLGVAWLAGAGMTYVRELNDSDAALNDDLLAEGSISVIRRLHLRGAAREFARGVTVTLAGLVTLLAARFLVSVEPRFAVLLAVAAAGVSIGAGLLGVRRLLSGDTITWFALGAAGSILWVVLR